MAINRFRGQNVYRTVEGDKRGKTRPSPSGGMVYTAVLETVSKGVSVRVRPWVQ